MLSLKEFLNSFQLWWKGVYIYNFYIRLSVRNIIFGVQENNHMLKSLNYCICLQNDAYYKVKNKHIYQSTC